MTARNIPCPYCSKRFFNDAGRYQHVKDAHPKSKRAHLKPAKRDDEESFADRAIEASIARACGEKTDDAWLLGDD